MIITESHLKKIIQQEYHTVLFEQVDEELDKSLESMNEGIVTAAALTALSAKAAALPFGAGSAIVAGLAPIITLLKLLAWAAFGAKIVGGAVVVYAIYRFIKFIYGKILDEPVPAEKEIDRILSDLRNKEDREKIAQLIQDKLSDPEKQDLFGKEADGIAHKIMNIFKKKKTNVEVSS